MLPEPDDVLLVLPEDEVLLVPEDGKEELPEFVLAGDLEDVFELFEECPVSPDEFVTRSAPVEFGCIELIIDFPLLPPFSISLPTSELISVSSEFPEWLIPKDAPIGDMYILRESPILSWFADCPVFLALEIELGDVDLLLFRFNHGKASADVPMASEKIPKSSKPKRIKK